VRILDRYVVSEFTRLFLLFVLAAPMLFILGDVTEHLAKYLGRGLPPGQVALSYVYQLPLFILYAFPIAALVATVFTVSGMTRHSEISAAKAGGVSFHRLVAPLPLLGVVLTLVAVGLAEVVPVTNRMRAEVLEERSRMRTSRADFVYRARDGRVFAIRRLDMETGRISGLAIEREGREPEVPGLHVTARTASWEPDDGWTLRDGYLRLLAGPGNERMFEFEELRPRALRETPEQLLALPKDPDEMRYAELQEFIEIIERTGGRPLDLMVKQAQKVAIPVATLVIILFGAPLATSSRRGGAAYGVGVSLAITIFYLMLFKITGAAGATGALSPMLSAWLPNMLFAVAAVVLMFRVRT
jgi:lipopolysaccharide export system permease protein